MNEIVEVTWLDAASDSVHCMKERIDTLKPIIRKNVGYLLKDEEDYITVVFGVICFEEHQYDNPLAIPRNMIKDIRKLG